jgi:hypothetical protein
MCECPETNALTTPKNQEISGQDPEDGSLPELSMDFNNTESVDKFLSKELMNLSVQDRNACLEEAHGVICLAPQESPAMIKEALENLSEELDKNLAQHQKWAYTQSKRIKGSYVETDDFRLRFLRAALFDIPTAAKLLAKFLDLALEFFGPFSLRRPVTLADFTKEEFKIFRKGLCQFLPFRDRRGRRILVVFHNEQLEDVAPSLRIKILLYMTYAAGTGDVDLQRRGIVGMIWCQDSTASYTFKVTPKNCRVQVHEFAAIRVSAMHICTPDTPFFRFCRAMWTIGVGGSSRSRLKIHVGEPVELQYALRAYGISTEQLPITWTGKIKHNYMRQWMRVRFVLEGSDKDFLKRQKQSETPMTVIECPTVNDVIFRQGTSTMYHPGNAFFRSMIQICCEEVGPYTTQRSTKNIVAKVMENLERKGGRVLLWHNNPNKNVGGGWWKQLTDEEQIYVKIEYTVREFKFSSTRYQTINRQHMDSDTTAFLGTDPNNNESCFTANSNNTSQSSFTTRGGGNDKGILGRKRSYSQPDTSDNDEKSFERRWRR